MKISLRPCSSCKCTTFQQSYFVAVCPRRPSYMGRGGIIFLINSSVHLCDVCVRARGAGADALSDRLAVDFSFLFVCLFVDQQFNQTSYIGSLVRLSWCLYCMYNFAEADTWSVCRDRVVNDCGKIIFILLSFSGSLAPSSRVLDRLTYDKQVCVQLPTYAENVALPTFAAERCAAAPCFCSRSIGPISSVHMGQTDTVPFHRPCSAYADGANKRRGHF